MIEDLGYRLTEPLPGYEAHQEVAPLPHLLREPMPSEHNQASVMILLMGSGNRGFFPLIKRQSHPSDPHTDQIGLPGGKKEISDPNPAFTALRETQEEIGIPSDKIYLVGALSPIYIPVSKYLVSPFIGWCEEELEFKLQESEVKDIFRCPVTHMVQSELFSHRTLKTSYSPALKVAGFELEGTWVWGATAMILSEFRQVMTQVSK
ncbi:MAG: CoA pyrophosphatase [Saprospiraceae bacterium]|nr:CoA pyrophosphatase [Saprospiraceae bacterium]